MAPYDKTEGAPALLFKVEILDNVEAHESRIVLNGEPVGPAVEPHHAPAVVAWFTGYLRDRTMASLKELGLEQPGTGVVQHLEHPDGTVEEIR